MFSQRTIYLEVPPIVEIYTYDFTCGKIVPHVYNLIYNFKNYSEWIIYLDIAANVKVNKFDVTIHKNRHTWLRFYKPSKFILVIAFCD